MKRIVLLLLFALLRVGVTVALFFFGGVLLGAVWRRLMLGCGSVPPLDWRFAASRAVLLALLFALVFLMRLVWGRIGGRVFCVLVGSYLLLFFSEAFLACAFFQALSVDWVDAAFGVSALTGLAILFRRWGRDDGPTTIWLVSCHARTVARVVLALYAALLFAIAVWRPWTEPVTPFEGRWDVPYTGTADLWRAGFLPAVFLFVGNIVCFVPFGFGLPALTRLRRSVVPICFLASILVEELHGIFAPADPLVGTVHILLNTLGAVLGYALFHAANPHPTRSPRRARRSPPRKPSCPRAAKPRHPAAAGAACRGRSNPARAARMRRAERGFPKLWESVGNDAGVLTSAAPPCIFGGVIRDSVRKAPPRPPPQTTEHTEPKLR